MIIRLHEEKLNTEGKIFLDPGDYQVIRALGFRRYIVQTNNATRDKRVITILNLNTDKGEIVYGTN